MFARLRLPLVFGILVILSGTAQIPSLRPTIAQALGLSVPLIAGSRGLAPLLSGYQKLYAFAVAFTAVSIIVEEFLLFRALILNTPVVYAWEILFFCGVAVTALLVQSWAAYRGLRSNFAAWFIFSILYVYILETKGASADRLADVLVAIIVGLLLGGGLGLALGRVVSRRPRSA